MRTVLIIDDNCDFRETVSEMLSDAGYDVLEASCPDRAFMMLEDEKVDLILCDLHMPFTDDARQAEFLESQKVGIETIKELGWVFPQIPIIAVSAATRLELAEAERQLGDLPLIPKPFSAHVLLQRMTEAFSFSPFPIAQ